MTSKTGNGDKKYATSKVSGSVGGSAMKTTMDNNRATVDPRKK
eukprot:CAMPEP_0169394392 /NCGR_PEP_ID=MMETSP1017-20121227/49991_1 /TAXON_ID=342587 /ORGANISM="Karlodinium micrum, Strain CCMP2283" /LENGTH=42 /DNA_ID= /DNA_START= /DNA_END= /DNA_ORIENTATION=